MYMLDAVTCACVHAYSCLCCGVVAAIIMPDLWPDCVGVGFDRFRCVLSWQMHPADVRRQTANNTQHSHVSIHIL